MAGIGFTPCRSMTAEDIRDLQCRAQQARRALGGRLVLGSSLDSSFLGISAVRRSSGLMISRIVLVATCV